MEAAPQASQRRAGAASFFNLSLSKFLALILVSMFAATMFRATIHLLSAESLDNLLHPRPHLGYTIIHHEEEHLSWPDANVVAENHTDTGSTSSPGEQAPPTMQSLQKEYELQETWITRPNTDYNGGSVVVAGISNLKESADECRQACLSHRRHMRVAQVLHLHMPVPLTPCNVWVYCPGPTRCDGTRSAKECWLKWYQNPAGDTSHRRDSTVQWITGLVVDKADAARLMGGAIDAPLPQAGVNPMRGMTQQVPHTLVPGHAARAAAAMGAQGSGGAAVTAAGVLPPLPRVCGSPAVDGYAHVDPSCFERSPTFKEWQVDRERTKLAGSAGPGSVGMGYREYLEQAADYDGLGVRWGIGHTKQSAQECAAACMEHEPGTIPGPFERLPCNAWTWCSKPHCFEPDAHQHSFGDCWLKFTELPHAPEVNMRGSLLYLKQRHPQAPDMVEWVSGVIVHPQRPFTNGTWSPRYKW
eukprot:jgi/Mesvir1/23885/Mv10674-RA.1